MEDEDYLRAEDLTTPPVIERIVLDKAIPVYLADLSTARIQDTEGLSLADLLSENTCDKACQANIESPDGASNSSVKGITPKISLQEILDSDSKIFTFTLLIV